MTYLRSTTTALATLLILGGMSLGCGPDGPGGSDTSTETLENDGEACLTNPSGNSDGVDPGPTEMTVTFNTCLSSSCDTLTDKNCSVSLDGDEVVVESSATIESEGGACTDDCGRATVTCDSPDLETGEYTLIHGDASRSFHLPSASESICTGEAPF